MTKLWVFQTNKQEFLDDCKKYQVYGVADPEGLGLCVIEEKDRVLIRLKFGDKNEFGYLGPFIASSKKRAWGLSVIQNDGIWKKIDTHYLRIRGKQWVS
jgi:hypothetical protein